LFIYLNGRYLQVKGLTELFVAPHLKTYDICNKYICNSQNRNMGVVLKRSTQKASHFQQHVKLIFKSLFDEVFTFIKLQTKTLKKCGNVFPHPIKSVLGTSTTLLSLRITGTSSWNSHKTSNCALSRACDALNNIMCAKQGRMSFIFQRAVSSPSGND